MKFTLDNRKVLMGNSKKKVLLCDDSAIIVLLVKSLIKRYSDTIEIITAENGLIGYEKWLQGGIDFVITDLEMPELSGWGLIEKLRDKNFDMKRIVVLSAALQANITPMAQKFGILKYYIKPVMNADIIEMVNSINNLESKIQLQ
jgi:YesN/AraC family two-component response regulator